MADISPREINILINILIGKFEKYFLGGFKFKVCTDAGNWDPFLVNA